MALKIGDIGLRAASAVVLAPAAVLATWAGGGWFCALVVAACGLLAFEWARMSAPLPGLSCRARTVKTLSCRLLPPSTMNRWLGP